jgi:hypothetical protein
MVTFTTSWIVSAWINWLILSDTVGNAITVPHIGVGLKSLGDNAVWHADKHSIPL